MIKTLKNLGGLNPTRECTGYYIIKFWHPAADKTSEVVQTVDTLEEAQSICSAPGSSYKEGPESTHYFLGYTANNSNTSHIQMWNMSKG